MKLVGAVCTESKNDDMRHGGFAPAQWVLGKFPRRTGQLLDENKLGQLGVLSAVQGPGTLFQMQALIQMRPLFQLAGIVASRMVG